MSFIASLPMYDLPEVRHATDAWWRAIAENARKIGGMEDLPDELDRSGVREDHWRSPNLLLSQTCGYPLMQEFYRHLRVLGAPCYLAEGCNGHDYRSAIVVRNEDQHCTIADMAGRRLVVNGTDSQSGYNVIKARIGELQLQKPGDPPFFANMSVSGQHRKSLAIVRSNLADIAAIDVVSLALIQQHATAECQGLSVIDYSAVGPSLPFVTSKKRTDEEVDILRRSIKAAMEDISLAQVRGELCLGGFDQLDAEEYLRINEITEQGRNVVLATNAE